MYTLVDNFKNDVGLWVKTRKISPTTRYFTRSYVIWNQMMARCNPNGKHQESFPTYKGCTVSDSFKDFQYFTDWHMSQVGFGYEGYHLDKDLLVEGNKTYCEDRCVLIPYALNGFLTSCAKARGIYPQGVTWHKAAKKFVAQINGSGKSQHIGVFNSKEEAFDAYKIAKEREARRWYQSLKDGEFVVDSRVIERMRTWTLPNFE